MTLATAPRPIAAEAPGHPPADGEIPPDRPAEGPARTAPRPDAPPDEVRGLAQRERDGSSTSQPRVMLNAGDSEDRFDDLLKRLQAGDERARDELFPVVYAELQRLARAQMSKQQPGHTLQPTALVNEAYLRLLKVDGRELRDRKHFYRLAALVMRQVLVDYARRKRAEKRCPEGERVPLDDLLIEYELHAGSLLELDDALEQLAGRDPRLAEVVELRFFGGRSIAEVSEIMEVSERQVRRWWDLARRLLKRMIGNDRGE